MQKSVHLNRDAFEVLLDVFKDREKADKFAGAIEELIGSSREKLNEEIVQKKEYIKIEIKDELKKELVTRELFEERFNVIDERFKSIDERFKGIDERFKTLEFKINILIALMMIVITFANPTFVALVEKIFK